MSLFDTKQEQGIHFIRFISSIEKSSAEVLKSSTKSWLAAPCEIHVMDFSMVKSIDPSCYSIFVLFSRDLKTHKKNVFTINASNEIKKQMKTDGLDTVFNPVDNINEVFKKSGQKTNKDRNKVNVDFINPFVKATLETLSVQANTKITTEKAFIKTADHSPTITIVGVISISSNTFNGTLSLAFSEKTFLEIYQNMVGEKHDKITPEIEDACGELLNIIFGMAKAELNNAKGYDIQKALPTVLVGEKIKIRQSSSEPVVVLPFATPNGKFFLEILAEHD